MLAAAVATATLAGLAVPSADAAVFGTQGIPSGPGVSQSTVDSAMRKADRAGARIVRIDADWAALQPNGPNDRDPAAIDALDRVTASAARRKIKVILSIGKAPCWASAAPTDVKGSCTGPDANRAEVTRYQPTDAESVVPIAAFIDARYADRLAALQIWNEPDQSNEKYFAGPDKVKKYVAMTKVLYPALKQAAPKVPVLAGSFVGTDGRWLKALYAEGMKGSYDGLAVQFYSRTLSALRSTRALMRANGDTKARLWLTEFGYTSCYRRARPALQIDQPCVSRSGAARGLRDVLTALRGRSYVKAAIQYKIDDDGPGGYSFGLFDRRGKAKPSYTMVRRVLRRKVRRPVAPTLHLRARGGQLVISGSASLTELLTLTVRQNGQLRFRATLAADARNRYRIVLPKVLGTRGLSVRLSAGYTGSRSARTR